ncbi:protein of unknown function DUF1385 [Denitrovibrio acetiphilus DSM 12809]|uniref:DUF1385 domain-containing protein n=1 Tax=Denitrovibrio acetiphilus (strain DSM 12809 / NBRC 114555 / N2460) TaxID=522772 RepID=D4H340_DENA2|nr:DUF1385 domain-containing protein [Denitrovibrio acetiphilus]ADD69063.1 protein of unknown function DUF1385 [Denitrovibrio acetiphilus DSM 12809]
MSKPSIGGQAVIEGVMMRAPSKFVIAVRKSKDEIVLKKEEVKIDKNWLFKKPLVRGLIALYDALILGIRALNFSAYHSTGEGEEKVGKWAMFFSMATGIGLGLLLFIYLPLQVTELSKHIFPAAEHSSLVYNGIDGIVRVVFFVIYVWVISFMKDIKRVFEYHGAEHKAIFTYEQGLDLTVENARLQSRFHPRCGTSFLIILMLVCIMVFSLIPNDANFFIKLGARLVFIPVIAGISYEILKFSGKHFENPIMKLLILPGLLVQKITTQEPDDSQLEVALISIRASLDMPIPEEGITIL